MANWEERDLRHEKAYQQTLVEELQRQHAQLQLVDSPLTTARQHFSDDGESGRTHLPRHHKPPQQRQYQRANNGYSVQRTNRGFLPASESDLATFRNNHFNDGIETDYVEFNRHQLKGHNDRKFIYPPKTYSDMFHKKTQCAVRYTNCNDTNVFGGSSTFLPYEAVSKSDSWTPSPSRPNRQQYHPNLPQYQYVIKAPTVPQNQLTGPHKYTVLPPISAYTPQLVRVWPSNPQRVTVDINLRLAQSDTDVTQTSRTVGAPAPSTMTSSQWRRQPVKRYTTTSR